MDTSTAQTPLILLPPSPSVDVVSAAYGLAHFFALRGAQPSLVCVDDLTKIAPFLTLPVKPTDTIRGLQDFIIQFNTKHNAIDDVRVTRAEHTIDIAVTPEKDFIDPRDFSFAPSQMHHDALFILGADTIAQTRLATPDNEPLLAELPHIIYTVSPKIPILSMHLYETLWHIDDTALSGDVAQSLLAGIVAATDGLRSDNISADLFRACSTLMRSGGDLQTIMLALYKTVSFDFLRLWGGILDNLTLSDSGRVATAIVPPLYSDDPLLLSLMLLRTAQFLPDVHVLGVFWSGTHDTQTHGMVLPTQSSLVTSLPSFFATVSHAPHDCLLIDTPDAPHVLTAQLDRALEIPQD